jgi:hypothetical protein
VLSDLLEARIQFLVGGGYAVNLYTSARCPTKDLDIFTSARAVPRLLDCLRHDGRTASLVDERWIGKIHYGEDFVDIIFGRAMGRCRSNNSGSSMREKVMCLGFACP